MQTDHVFFHARENAKEKRLKSKEIVANAYDYFEEVSRCQRTQGPLKRTSDVTGVSHTSIKRLRRERKLTLVELLFQLQQIDTDTSDTC